MRETCKRCWEEFMQKDKDGKLYCPHCDVDSSGKINFFSPFTSSMTTDAKGEDVLAASCTHKRTETVGLPEDWCMIICLDCGMVQFSTPSITVEFFPKIAWRRGWRPDTDKKEDK